MVVVATACRVDADVAIHVDADGSGTVTVVVVIDREAAEKLGDPASAIKTDDMTAAGWKVASPVTDKASGKVTLRAVREFASPGELAPVLAEIGGGSPGAPGVFSGVKLRIAEGFSSTTYRFSAGVSLTGSLEEFSDAALAKGLGGLPLGRTAEELKAEGAADSVLFTVTVDLPGSKVDTNGQVTDGKARWTFRPASETPTETTMRADSRDRQTSVPLLIGGGAVLVLVATGLVVAAVTRSRR